jgi:hypothetical protein
MTAHDAEFEVRWTAWLARGRAHELRVRKTLVLLGGVLAAAAALVYAFVIGR